jgi:hypothetical protein
VAAVSAETKRTLCLKRELVRIAFAGDDFRAALWITRNALADPTETPTGGGMHRALWSAAVIAYGRPFSVHNRIGALPKSYRRGFPDERLRSTHKMLLRERDRNEAHTDEMQIANVAYVSPPGANTPRGTIGVGRIPYSREAITDVADLSLFQRNRVLDRAEEIIEELYGGQTWPRGHLIRLVYPTDAEIDSAAV